jgi:hypothetical protein
VDHDPPFKNQTALEAAKTDFDYLSGLLASCGTWPPDASSFIRRQRHDLLWNNLALPQQLMGACQLTDPLVQNQGVGLGISLALSE